jgi:hypothetical protein
MVAYGPARTRDRSSTRTPFSARGGAEDDAGAVGVAGQTGPCCSTMASSLPASWIDQ